MATINLTQLKKEKEAKPASSFNNAPTIVLNKGKSSVETPRTNYDFSDRTAEPVQRKTLQTPVVTAPQTTTVNQQINRPAQQDQYGLWDNAGYVVEQAGKGLQGGIGGLVNAASTFLDKPFQTVNALGSFGSKYSTSNDYSQYDPATAEALRQKDAEIEQLRRQMYSNLDENFLDPIAQKGVELGAGMIAESQESNYDRDKLSGVGRFTGDVAKAVTGMAPSLAVGAVAGPGAGLAVMGTGAYGQSLQQALNDGASYEDAVVYGLASAGVEIATEKLFGGIPFFGDGAVDDVLKEWMQAKLGQGTGKKVVSYLMDSVGEGAEEYISEVAGEFLVDIYTDERKDKDFFDRLMDVQDDAFYSFLLGAVTGGVMGAPGTILQSIKSGKTQEQSAEVQKTPTEKDPMKAMINEDAKAEAQKIVADMGQSTPVNDYVAEGLKSDNVAVKMEAQKKNAENIRKSAKKLNIDKQVEEIIQVSNKLGKTIEFTEDLVDQKAWGANTGEKIILSKKSGDMIQQIFVHELTHDAENSQLYSELETELSNLAAVNGVDVTALTEQMIRDYAEQGVSLDDVGARAEVNARIAQEYLFKESGIKQLANTNLSLAQKVFNWVRSLRIKLSGTEAEKQLLKTEQLYKKAIYDITQTKRSRGLQGSNAPSSTSSNRISDSSENNNTQYAIINDKGNKLSNSLKSVLETEGSSILERSKDPAVRARAQMEKRIRHTFLFNKKSNPLKMYDVTARIEDEFERTGKISEDLRKELFATAYEETLRSSDVSYKELPEFKQMLQEDLNRAVSQYENTLIKERELKKFAEENDIDVSEVRLSPTTGFLKNVKPEDLPDKIISYKKLKASLKNDLINQVDNYSGGKVIDELIDKAAIEIVEDGFISSPTKFEIRQEMIKNGYSINSEAMNDNKELYDFIKSTKFNVPRGFGREIQDFDRTKKLLKTSTQDGQSIDKVYQELRSRFGEFFLDDLTNPADQYQQIADVMAELEPTRLMLEDSEQYSAEMRQYLEDNFTDRLEDFKNQILYRSQKDYYDRAAKKQVAYDEAMNQVSEKISEKFFKENKDIDELQKSEHVIKSASIEDLSEVIAKIQDRGALSKTLAQNLDAMANGDVMLRAKLSEIFEKPLREAKKTYVTNQKRVLNDVYKRIVTDLGIKMGSKESAAMMWYGEGQKQLNKVKGKVESDQLEVTPYTLDDLKKDFPKTWQNIVEADKIMRKYYDEYVDRINESLSQVYAESILKESVIEKRTQIQKDIREAQERLEQLKAQRTGEVGGPDLEARINAQRNRITDLSRQFNNVAEDVYRNKRLKKRSDYYHHFQEVGFAENIQQILNVDSANNISNALAGISEYTKPKSKWEKFMQRRSNVARYEEDAIKGFLKYAPAAEYKISFDPYVAQLRGTIQDMIKLSDEANLNNAKAINWLTNYTNSLAGKTNPMDRWLTHTEIGRTVLQMLNKANSRVKGNAVVGNLNSAVSQFYNLPNGLAVLTDNGGAQASLDVAKGSADYSAYAAKKLARQDVSDSPINQSVFLAERYIDSTIDQFDERIIHKPAQAATFLLTFGDQVVAEQLWFSAYNQALRLGKNDPIAYADDLVARAVGGRGIGEVPLMQQSQVVKLIAPFQVEVNNAWQLMKQMGGSALKDKDKALGLLVMYGMTWIMNEINEALTGNRAGMDIFNAIEDAVKNWDPEKNLVANTFNSAGRLGGEILSNVPMGAQIAQMVVADEYYREKLFGEADPSRFNTGNIGINALMDPAVQLATGQNVDWQSLVTNFVTPYGGKQLNRFYKMAEDAGLIPRVDFNINDGLQASWKPGAYNDKGRLKYQIDTSDPLNVLKGFMFGTYATNEGKNYLDNEYTPLSDKKTTLYENAVEAGADPVEFYNALREANYSRNLVDKNGESIDNSKAAMNREALERNNSFDEVKKLIESGQAEASDFGLNKAVFEWTQEEFNKFMKSLNK